MVKKLILTESQYDKLTRFILESTFQEIVDDVVQAGDVLRIGFKDKTRNFKVVNKAGNQIIMDNIDKGSPENVYRAFMSITSFNNGNLELKVVNKETEPDKIGQIGKWTKKIFNNITDIEVIRNDNVIDTVGEEPEKPLEKAVSDDFKTLIDDSILIFINQVKEGSGVVFKVAEENINFCCVGRNGGKFSFELNSDSTNKELTAWDSFAFELKGDGEKEDEDLYELNKHLIKTDDEGQTFNLRLLGSLGEKAKYVWIKNIYDIESTPKCAPKPKKAKEEKPEDDDQEREYNPEEFKVALDLIVNDPLMKKAFYSQPTLLNLIVNGVRGTNPKGSGISSAMEIIAQYETSKFIKNLGEEGNKFHLHKNAKFNFYRKTPESITDKQHIGPVDYEIGDNGLSIIDNDKTFKIVILRNLKGMKNMFEVAIYLIEKDETTGLPLKDEASKSRDKFKFKQINNAIVQFTEELGSGYYKE